MVVVGLFFFFFSFFLCISLYFFGFLCFSLSFPFLYLFLFSPKKKEFGRAESPDFGVERSGVCGTNGTGVGEWGVQPGLGTAERSGVCGTNGAGTKKKERMSEASRLFRGNGFGNQATNPWWECRRGGILGVCCSSHLFVLSFVSGLSFRRPMGKHSRGHFHCFLWLIDGSKV